MTEPSDVGLRGHLTRADRAVPAVGAVTPKDEHVIADFEKKTADQGLNPFSSESLAELLTVSPRRATAGRTASVREVLRPPPMPTTSQFSRIAIKANGTILFIDSGDIIAIEVKGNYLSLLHRSGSYILHESITMAEKKLNLHGFVRIHRSVLVNAAFVEELRPWSTGKYVIRLKGGRNIRLRAHTRRICSSSLGHGSALTVLLPSKIACCLKDHRGCRLGLSLNFSLPS